MVAFVEILIKPKICFDNVQNICCMQSSRHSLKEAEGLPSPTRPQLEVDRAVVQATLPPKVTCRPIAQVYLDTTPLMLMTSFGYVWYVRNVIVIETFMALPTSSDISQWWFWDEIWVGAKVTHIRV